MFFRMIYDENLAAAAYLLGCQRTGEAIVIDPQRDIDRYLAAAKQEGLRITAVTETHIHADFLSGVREVAEQTDAVVYLSNAGGSESKYEWLDAKSSGGSYRHQLLQDGSLFHVGQIEFRVIHTPGHTPEHISFLVTDRGAGATEPIGIISGDFLFVGDLGRPDLLETAVGRIGSAERSARTLFQSAQKLKDLADFLQVWPAHGAGSACGKSLGAVPASTIGYELRFNPALRSARAEQEFVDYILAGQPEPPLYFARMKRENKEGPKILGLLPEPRALTISELKNIDPKRDVLIDTRNWTEFSKAHIAGSFFHPLNRSFITDIGAMVGDNPRIYLICEATQVRDTCRNLVRIGLDQIEGWIEPAALAVYSQEGGQLVQTKEGRAVDLQEKVASKLVQVLDVRKFSEYQEGHINGAQNIAHTRLASRLDEVSADKPIVVHCKGGGRSAYACSLLERAGYAVTNLTGGISDWEKAGCPVERSG